VRILEWIREKKRNLDEAGGERYLTPEPSTRKKRERGKRSSPIDMVGRSKNLGFRRGDEIKEMGTCSPLERGKERCERGEGKKISWGFL